MDIKGVIKDDGDKRSRQQALEANETSTINFFNIAGALVILAGLYLGYSYSNIYTLVLIASIGIIIVGIGEVLRYLHKIANK